MIGSITPSSHKLTMDIISKIDAIIYKKVILEIGPGSGVFTDQIIPLLHYEDTLILIELNTSFYMKLKEKYKEHTNIIIINDDATHLLKILKSLGITTVDYIISGLPLTSLPKSVSLRILISCKKAIVEEGYVSLFQYSQLYSKYLKKLFDVETHFVLKNIPSAFVFHLKKKTNYKSENV